MFLTNIGNEYSLKRKNKNSFQLCIDYTRNKYILGIIPVATDSLLYLIIMFIIGYLQAYYSFIS